MEYVDDLVIDGFFSGVECSLKFLLDNTGGPTCTCIFMMFLQEDVEEEKDILLFRYF